MHDPSTVAFEIRYPWKRKSQLFPEGYRDPFITIWHVDPESDGSDDSCGFTYPNISKVDYAKLCKLAEQEFEFQLGKHGYKQDTFQIVYNSWWLLKYQMLGIRKPLTAREIDRIMSLSFNPGDNLRWKIEINPHSDYIRKEPVTVENLQEIFVCVYRQILHLRRPWYRKPRWHVHHWRFQVHPLQQLRRWLFTRCATCGGRFGWGKSGVTNQWDRPRLKWWQGEVDLHHHDCFKSQ